MDRRSVLKLLSAVPFFGGLLVGGHAPRFVAPFIDRSSPLVFRKVVKHLDPQWLFKYSNACNRYAWGGFGKRRLRVTDITARILDESNEWEVLTHVIEGDHDLKVYAAARPGRIKQWHTFVIYQQADFGAYEFGEQVPHKTLDNPS